MDELPLGNELQGLKGSTLSDSTLINTAHSYRNMYQNHGDVNDYGDDDWDDDLGLRKVYSNDVAERRAVLELSGENRYEEVEGDVEVHKKRGIGHGSDDDDVQTVHTVASRTSIDENGHSSFDRATRVKLHQKYHRAVRCIECDKIRSWVNAVEVTASYCPVQRQYYQRAHSRMPVQELRMRAVGVAAGSGFTIAVFDLEMGIVLRKCLRVCDVLSMLTSVL